MSLSATRTHIIMIKTNTDNNRFEFFCNTFIIILTASYERVKYDRIRTKAIIYYENSPMQYTGIFAQLNMRKISLERNDNFYIVAQNIDNEYTLELPRRGGSYEYPQSIFWIRNKKKCIPLYTPASLRKCRFEGI